MNQTIIVLIICSLAAGFVVWQEYKRANKFFLTLRIVACILAFAALAGIALPANYSKDVSRQNDHCVGLLTAGFERDSLKNYGPSQLFTFDRSVEKAYPKAKLIRPDELKTDSPAIIKLQVFGYGLEQDELSGLDHLPVVFHPAPAPGGIISISWNRKMKTGERLTVEGKYKNHSARPVKLILEGLNTQLDTAAIAATTTADFDLSTVPKNEGRAVYHVLAIAANDTLVSESLPVEIDPVKQLKILMLSASPDFETRFLKNWLSEKGFSVAVRSAISKDKFSSEFVNMPPLQVDRLNSDLLDKFDLVIGDLSVLEPESALLKQHVTQKGLGIIIRADSSFKASSWLQNDFPVEKVSLRNQPPATLIIQGRKNKLAPVKTGPDYINMHQGTQPLVYDLQNHLLVNTALVGTGRLAYSTISTTYDWVLAGDKDDYGAFWSLLISKTSRKMPSTGHWSVASRIPVVNEPAGLQLASSSFPGQIIADHTIVAPEQDPVIPFEWSGTYWPLTPGWHSITENNSQPAWWYAFSDSDWAEVRATEKLSATRKYAETYSADSSVTKPIHEKVRIEVPKIYFYLLLLIAVTFLWVEGKLSE